MTLSTLLFLLAITLVFSGLAAVGVLWAVKNGQYDDLEGPAQPILMDDDDPMIPFRNLNPSSNRHKIDD